MITDTLRWIKDISEWALHQEPGPDRNNAMAVALSRIVKHVGKLVEEAEK